MENQETSFQELEMSDDTMEEEDLYGPDMKDPPQGQALGGSESKEACSPSQSSMHEDLGIFQKLFDTMPQNPDIAWNLVDMMDKIVDQDKSYADRLATLQSRCLQCLAKSCSSLSTAEIVKLPDQLSSRKKSFIIKLFTQTLLQVNSNNKSKPAVSSVNEGGAKSPKNPVHGKPKALAPISPSITDTEPKPTNSKTQAKLPIVSPCVKTSNEQTSRASSALDRESEFPSASSCNEETTKAEDGKAVLKEQSTKKGASKPACKTPSLRKHRKKNIKNAKFFGVETAKTLIPQKRGPTSDLHQQESGKKSKQLNGAATSQQSKSPPAEADDLDQDFPTEQDDSEEVPTASAKVKSTKEKPSGTKKTNGSAAAKKGEFLVRVRYAGEEHELCIVDTATRAERVRELAKDKLHPIPSCQLSTEEIEELVDKTRNEIKAMMHAGKI